MSKPKQILSAFLSCSLVLVTLRGGLTYADEPTSPTPLTSAPPTAQQLQQLVAPIALYPDSLVAEILAASTYPDQVVEADRWLRAHPELKGDQLAQAVDQQSWDPSVKALMEFPTVLANMDKNLSWTSSLGDAYIDNQQAVMNAVQRMRQSAKKAGNLNSSSQMKVSQQGQTIVIEPANSQVVYVPEFDPWIVYGLPVAPWPGWVWYPGLYWTSPGLAFGLGFGVGLFSGFAWGWHSWAPDWHHNVIVYNHNTYISHSRTLVHRTYYANRAGANARRTRGAVHGASGLRGGSHGSAFGGFNRGGVTRGFSDRGFRSFGGSHGGGRR